MDPIPKYFLIGTTINNIKIISESLYPPKIHPRKPPWYRKGYVIP